MSKILIVDDSNLSRRILRNILETEGHAVVEAQDGLAALEAYTMERPAVVFLDMTMKGMPGLDVLTQLRSVDPGVQVIVGTADIQVSTRQMVEQAGARAFVHKPFTAEKVMDALNPLLISLKK